MSNRLKISSLNAKYDELITLSNCHHEKMPDSLVATMLSVALLPSKADIINVQNVNNEKVVKFLMQEINRVNTITERFSSDRVASRSNVLASSCELNSMTNLCDEAREIRNMLTRNDRYKLEYVSNVDLTDELDEDTEKSLFSNFYKYVGINYYDAYFNGTSLTLVNKALNICPEVMTIPCVESLVLFFSFNDRKLINVNVDLGAFTFSTEKLNRKKKAVDAVVCFLKQYENCGSVIMGGSIGDLDYDTPQLLYSGDSLTPEIAQRISSKSANPVPSDFPCDTNDSIYQLLEYLLKTCNAEHVPYSWLLQYLRVKGDKKSSLMKLVKEKSCIFDSGCSKKSCDSVSISDSVKSSKSSKSSKLSCKSKKSCNNECDKCPGSHPKHMVRKDSCTFKKVECLPCDSKFLVKENLDEKLCETKKSCCKSCSSGGKCDSNVCSKSCDNVDFCDSVTLLKRELSLNNVLENISDVNDRFTGFYNHFNKSLDCKYPRGIFQAWAMCDSYKTPKDKCRMIANNSELLALDHILVSDDLKNNVSCVSLSDLCVDLCGETVKRGSAGQRLLTTSNMNNTNTLCKIGLTVSGEATGINDENNVPDYSGGIVKSFFTNRVYSMDLEFNTVRKLRIDNHSCCDDSLNTLGLTSLWCALSRWNQQSVGIERFIELGLDQHPYFVNWFYDNVVDTFATKNLQSRIDRHFGSCTDESMLLQIEKRNKFTESEFYKHLLMVSSEVHNRERFVINVGFVEAIVKALDTKTITVNKEEFNTLFKVLDLCTVGSLNASAYLSSLDSMTILNNLLSSALGIMNVKIGDLETNNMENESEEILRDVGVLGTYIRLLNKFILENCVLMDVLVTNVVSQIAKTSDCKTNNNDLISYIISRCGSVQPIRDALSSLVDILPFKQDIKDLNEDEAINALYDLVTKTDRRSIITRIIDELTESGDEITMIVLLSELDLVKVIEDNVVCSDV